MIVFLTHLAVFLLLGPPVGALALFVGMAIYGWLQSGDVSGLAWVPLFGIIYAVPLSYLIGGIPAAIAGAVIGAKAALRGPVGLGFAVLTGIGVGLGLVAMGGRPIVAQGADTVSSALLVCTCLVATLVCSGVARLIIATAFAQRRRSGL